MMNPVGSNLDFVYFNHYKQTMSLENETKINKLLKNWPVGTVDLSSWLADNGISSQILNRYKKSGWLESIRGCDNIRLQYALPSACSALDQFPSFWLSSVCLAIWAL